MLMAATRDRRNERGGAVVGRPDRADQRRYRQYSRLHQSKVSSGNAGDLDDITQGNNGDFYASAGWDACTGLGRPDGKKVASALGVPPASAPKVRSASRAVRPGGMFRRPASGGLGAA